MFPPESTGWRSLSTRLHKIGPVAVVSALTMAASLLATPAGAQDAGGPYPDTSPDAYYAQAVGVLAQDGLFAETECEAGFCPDESLDRATMAVWAVRAIDDADPAPVASTRFADVEGSHRHAAFIERFAELRVTSGCGDGTRFCPDDTVTRAQMAVFLSRAFNLPDGPDPGFADVPADEWYAQHVAKLAASGITAGCGDGTRFCPNDPTSRAQMAVFIARATGRIDKPTVPSTPDIAINLMLLEDAEDTASSGTASLVAINRHGQKRVSADVRIAVSSPDGTRIAYETWSEDQKSGGFHVVDADGANTTKITDSTGGWEWSPDGTRITYMKWSEDGNGLYVVDADGTNTTKITDSLNSRWGWSPDGTRIAYETWSEDGNGLYVVDADGTNTTKITDSLDWHWDWSPDGTRIAYMTESDDGDSHALHVADADGTNTTKITDSLLTLRSARRNWKWSPDGTRIAYIAKSDDGDSYALHVADADGTNTTKIPDSSSAGRNWDWSPDGTRIAYRTNSEDPEDRSYVLNVADANGTDVTKITDSLYSSYPWYWSPDGTRIAYTTRSEDRSDVLHVTDADGTNAVIELRPVRTFDESERGCEERFSLLRWSPNNEYLIYAIAVSCRDVRVRKSINVVKTDGSYHSHLKRAFALAWSPDSTRFAYLTNEDGRVRVIEENIDDQRTTVLLDIPLVPLVVDCDFGIQSWIQWTSVGIYPKDLTVGGSNNC